MKNLGNSEDGAFGSEEWGGIDIVKMERKGGWDGENRRKGVRDEIGRDMYKQQKKDLLLVGEVAQLGLTLNVLFRSLHHPLSPLLSFIGLSLFSGFQYPFVCPRFLSSGNQLTTHLPAKMGLIPSSAS